MIEAPPAWLSPPIVDIDICVVGNQLVGVDVDCDGNRSIMKSDLGTYESPEHAEVMKELMFNPKYTYLISSGIVTKEFVDNVVSVLRQQRATAQPDDNQR